MMLRALEVRGIGAVVVAIIWVSASGSRVVAKYILSA